jgi:hypothetical protein
VTPGEDGVWTGDPDIPLNSLVYISASNTVAEADASSQDTMMAIGFVSSKNGASCSVRSAGELSGFEDLIPGRTYYAGKEPGAIWTPSEEDEIFPLVVQVVGRAKTEEVLLVMINPGPFILVPPVSP